MDDAGKKHILVLGAGGMLGNAIFRLFAGGSYEVAGTLRTAEKAAFFAPSIRDRLICDFDATCDIQVAALLERLRPDVAINCIGIIKQQKAAKDPLTALTVNALLPHRLARQCSAVGTRLVHLSTDCVFSGHLGSYRENDFADADDLYGRSKYLGEVDYPNTVTLRTSIIGHEIGSCHSLVDWFMSQSGVVPGYTKAIFSGLPTIEVARVIRDHLIPDPSLSGVYHLSADPVSKHDLLALIARVYDKPVEIRPDASVVIDRSLDSTRFRSATDYAPPPWPELIRMMYHDRAQSLQTTDAHTSI